MEQTSMKGCGCTHEQEKPTQILTDEHRVIERVIGAVETMAKRPIGPLEPWKRALDFIRHFADACHHYKEEKVLFPALEEHGIPIDGGPIGMMLVEHEEGRAYVRSMLAAIALLETGNQAAGESLAASAQAYCRLLREHIQKEDEILFRMADEAFDPDEAKKIARAFAEHEAGEMGAGTHETYLKIAEELAAAARS